MAIGSSFGSTFCEWSGLGLGRRVRTGPESRPTEKPFPLRRDPRFQPCATEPGDELYPHGIFEFNISRLIASSLPTRNVSRQRPSSCPRSRIMGAANDSMTLLFMGWRAEVAGAGVMAEARAWLERHGILPRPG